MKLTRQTVQVFFDNERLAVSAWVPKTGEPIAIHRIQQRGKSYWRIAHVPTGYGISGTFGLKAHAIQVAEFIRGWGWHWDTLPMPENIRQLGMKFRSVLLGISPIPNASKDGDA